MSVPLLFIRLKWSQLKSSSSTAAAAAAPEMLEMWYEMYDISQKFNYLENENGNLLMMFVAIQGIEREPTFIIFNLELIDGPTNVAGDSISEILTYEKRMSKWYITVLKDIHRSLSQRSTSKLG